MYFGLLCFYTYFQEKEVSKCVQMYTWDKPFLFPQGCEVN